MSGHSVITYSSRDESKHRGWNCAGLIEFRRVFGGKIIWPTKEEFAHNIGYDRILVGLWYIGIWTLNILVLTCNYSHGLSTYHHRIYVLEYIQKVIDLLDIDAGIDMDAKRFDIVRRGCLCSTMKDANSSINLQ